MDYSLEIFISLDEQPDLDSRLIFQD